MWSTISAASRRAPSSGSDPRRGGAPARPAAVALLLAALLVCLAAPAPASPLAAPRPTVTDAAALADLRAARRAAVRAGALAKRQGGAPFGLLVICVDFADRRFPPGFDPAADLRLTGGADGTGSLAHYVSAAAQGRTALAITVAPVVSLPGTRQDYSDLGWQGFSRSRAMVRLALEGAAAAGAGFAAADRDGDGEVDGVLLLHAGAGLENDPAGLIVPMQYFLDEPVVHRGTLARSYAIAAATSTLGIWAHETGHLLGLEDRYDLELPGSAETGPRGGLGRFSLMAAGWQGTGEGRDPALPDAWSRLQLGWADLDTVPRPGAVVRLRAAGPPAGEFFLAERRDPVAAAPYDAGLPADRLLIYHVDPSLAAGEASSSGGPDRHLQVELVEADGGREIARGESQGELADLFPSFGASQGLDDQTVPDSRTWTGEPTGVDVLVSVHGGEVTLDDRGPLPWADVRLMVEADAGGFRVRPIARLLQESPRPDTLTVTVGVLDARWGRFEGGDTLSGPLLREDDPATWEHYRGPAWRWQPAADVPPDAVTPFVTGIGGGGAGPAPGAGHAEVVWDPDHADLSLAGEWTARWTVTRPGGATGATWHRWRGDHHAGLPDADLLAATGESHVEATAWPAVRYGNGAHARLESGPLGTANRWVEVVHAVDLELLFPGSAADGVAFTWVHASGTTVGAEPVDGWAGVVDPRARHPLAGRPTFAWADPLGADDRPLWHREALPLPDVSAHGPGPWRLRAELAANPVFGARGWLLLAPAAYRSPPPDSGFSVTLHADRLTWSAPGVAGLTGIRIERSVDGGQTWRTAATASPLAGSVARDLLDLPAGRRARLRVVAEGPVTLVSRVLVVAASPEVVLGPPRPNPAHDQVGLALDGGGDPDAELAVFDLRGRRIAHWTPGGGPATILWDGTDHGGRRVAAGVYVFRLAAAGAVVTRKVTWLP